MASGAFWRVFSVRSAYKLGLAAQSEQCVFADSSTQANPYWAKIWRAAVPPKVKTFARKVASNALATEANKLHRIMRVTGHYKICGADVEDVAHCLYICPHARMLWDEMRMIWSLPAKSDLQQSPHNWFYALISKIPDHLVVTTLLVAWRAYGLPATR
jgi:hypothetical protein